MLHRLQPSGSRRSSRDLRCLSSVAGTLAVLLVASLSACRQARAPLRKLEAAAAPQVRATVVTVQTTIHPANKSFTHTIVIAGGRARSMDELDQWRLYDLQHDRVTYVDEIARTYRIEGMESVLEQRRAAMARPAPDGAPRPQLVKGNASKVLAGVAATPTTIRAGRYVRELWIGAPPAIPANLFAMMQATEPAGSSFAPMMRGVDQVLLATRGFPLAEHAELPFEDKKLVVDRVVVRIDTHDVPESLLNVPAGYTDLTPPPPVPKPASKR